MSPKISKAADNNGMPDFAYPQTVIKNAMAALDKADSTPGSGPARLRAVLEIYAAKRAVDTDSLFEMPAFVEKQAQTAGLTDADKAMFTALEAQILNTIYSYQRYKYDQVDAPMEPLPADINLWSGKQFKARIGALYDEAIVLADATPLTKYASDVEYSDECLNYVPDVAAFVAYRKACWLKENASDQRPYLTFAREMATRYDAGTPAAIYWLTCAADNNRKTLRELYDRYSTAEAARYILLQMCNGYYYNDIYYNGESAYEDDADAGNGKKERNAFIEILRESLAKFPKWYGNPGLANELTRLTRPNVTLEAPKLIAPGSDIKIGVQAEFARTIKISLYRTTTTDVIPGDLVRSSKPLCTETLRFDGADTTTTVSMHIPSPGYYVIIPKIDDNAVERFGSMLLVEASYLIPVAVNNLAQQAVIVADINSGAPVKDTKVTLHKYTFRRYSKDKSVNLGRTGADGTLYFQADTADVWAGQYLSFAYKGYSTDFMKGVRTSPMNDRNDEARAKVLFFTSRPVYHPGDTIEWAAAIAMPDGVCAGKKVKVTLRDANYEDVATLDLTTDASGRISGSFPTAKGTLTGYWIALVEYDSQRSTYSIMVSDFRMPVFYTEITAIERDVPAAGAVRITGKATTFSGMPVAGAEVAVKVSGAQRWRWFGADRELGTLTATTDASGNYTVDIPAEMLAEPVNYGRPFDNFYVNVTVTAADASTAEASQGFTTGKPYVLAASTALGVADTSDPLKATFSAYAADGSEANIAVNWKLCPAGNKASVVRTGSATTGAPADLDLSGIAAGNYTLYIEPADKALAEPATGFTITLFNERAGDVPASDGLFVPYDYTQVNDGKTDILVGISGTEAYVYSIVREGSDLMPIKVHRLTHGFHRLALDVENADDCSVRLVSVADGRVYDSSVSVRRPKAPAYEVVAESFRDRLAPGSGESWRFRLVDGNKAPVADAAMIATLYNRALDEIHSARWPSAFTFYSRTANMYLNMPSFGNSFTNNLWGEADYLCSESLMWPRFRFVDMSNYMRIRGRKMMRATAAAPVMDTSAAIETEDYEEEEAYMEKSSNRLYEAATAESVAAEPTAATGAAADNGAPEPVEPFKYRSGDVYQAFWEPALTADANGNIDINFTVPDANGTWQLRSFAWAGPGATASYMAECLSNKPVMVQPNLPRFLRQNDSARVLATVYNNSDEEQTVTTTVEIFRLADGAITATAVSTDVIAPKGSAIAAIELTAPVDAAAIGYRVRSVAGTFADGEQTFIPVLASATTVIESTEFYLNPDDKEPFTLTVKADKNASLTLQYCQNPVWTAVKAMRGIAGSQSGTATGLAGKLFSALAAEKVIAGNADIAAAVRNWADNPSEAALTSMLEKNENLKCLMLDQTPWVQAAASETSRMEALAQVLDPRTTEATLNSVFDALYALQNNDGGFAWTSWSRESSVWATENVLTTLGIANSLGMLDNHPKIKRMIQPAFNYLTTQALKPDKPSTDMALTLIAALMPDLDTLRAKRILALTTADIKGAWKTYGTCDKAWAVLILKNEAPEVADNILESIRQHSVIRQGTGMSFPNVNDIRAYATILQAFAAMDAPRNEIDAMRQWILVQAQASDDFGAYNPDYLIAALLMTGSNWTSVPVAQSVTVNGAPLTLSAIESATGYFSSTIVAAGGKTTVTVSPNGVTPSYGSVVAISRKPMTKVKARPGRDISISKRVLVERDGEWVETNEFGLGERLRVQLTVVTKRNLDYVTIDDERPAAFEPVDQLPGYIWNGGIGFYRENLDASTRLFIGRLSKGTYHITYDMTANVAGSFISGIATLQSQYAPELTAHSAGNMITVNK